MGTMDVLSRVILIVERDHESRVQLRRQLEDAGYFVASATSGIEALSVVEKISQPHLVLVNPTLPDADDFLSALKGRANSRDIAVAELGSHMAPLIEGSRFILTPEDVSQAIAWLRDN